MPGNFNPDIKLPVEEDKTATLGFEPASRNVILVKPGHCPQCLRPMGIIRPMGIKGQQKSATVKVWTAEGLDYWCQECVEKGLEKKTCMRYRHFSKKERKQLQKQLKKIRHEENKQTTRT